MALVLADRVQETTLTTGTGDVTLAGAVQGFQTFAVIGNGNSTFYTIADQGGSNWEVGIGTYTSSGTTLSRDTVLASSNGGSLVNFGSGTKTAFVTYPSEKSVNLDIAGNVNIPNQLVIENTALTTSNTSNLVIGGPLNFTDTGIVSNFVGDTDGYYQAAIQNTSNGAAATAEWIAYNDNGTSTDNYAAMGINSSGYAGTGAINGADHAYFISGSTDIVVGTISNNSIHLVTNSSATDAMTINGVGAVAFNGQYGTSGGVLTSNGSGTPPTWGSSPVDQAYFLSFMMG
jgi:hypothetical protein